MGQLRIRGTSAELPVFDFDVRTVTSLSDSVSGFEFGAASVRALDIGHVGLQDGRIRAVRAERFGVTAVDVRSVEFTGCVLRGALFDGCDLALAGFGPGSYRGCDLRGNDLSAVTGVHNLKRVIVDRAQLLQLAEALAVELDVSFGEDLPYCSVSRACCGRRRSARPSGRR